MRISLEEAHKRLGKINNAVEVGVLRGEYSKVILDSGVGFLYLVDPYLEDDMYSQKQLTEYKESMLRLLEPYNNKKFIELPSVEASKQFEDNSLDYVYIDGCHLYEYVRDDIAAWYPKVRSGGILSGHDFGCFSTAGVILAVSELCKKYNLSVFTRETSLLSYLKNPNGGDWFVVKP